MAAVEEPEERSLAAGACVLVVLAGVVVGMALAVDEAAGVLLVVTAGVVALWRSARRKGTDLPLPSPTAHPSPRGEQAGQTVCVHREGMLIYRTPDAENPLRTHVRVELFDDESHA